MKYLQTPDGRTNKKVQRQAIKYTSLDGNLYRWTVDGLLLKCLN
jgi:hypothetical protein